VGYWSFDEGYGTTAQDRTSNNNDGTITGATWQTEDMCVSGKCLKYSGTGSSVGINSMILDLDEQYTISLWFKVNNWTDYSSSAGLMQGPNSRNWDDCISVRVNSVEIQDDSAVQRFLYPEENFGLNQWYHIVINFTSDDIDLYIDGVYQDNVGSYATNSSLTIDKIGEGYGSDEELNGFMDEVKIYPYARTAAQIKADYNSGKAGLSADKGSAVSMGGPTSIGGRTSLSDGLVGYWKMDEASGNVLDASGNGNTGTPTGTTVIAGQYGNGRSFNGSSDYVSVGSSIVPVDTFSISAWIMRAGSDCSMIVDQYLITIS